MNRILRKITGKEGWKVGRPEMQTSHPGFEVWDDADVPCDLVEALKGVIVFIDVQEHDGDAPTQWAIEFDGKILATIDATILTAEQRVGIVPDEVREEAREIANNAIKEEVDETLRRIEDQDKDEE